MKNQAFSLIEMLFVAALITVLIGIAIPVAKTARQQASALGCSSNLRQLGLVIATYESDNGNILLPADPSWINPGSFSNNNTWTMLLGTQGYLERIMTGYWQAGTMKVMRCPTLDKRTRSDGTMYGMNGYFATGSNQNFYGVGGTKARLGKVTSPANVVRLMDTFIDTSAWSGTGSFPGFDMAASRWHMYFTAPPPPLGNPWVYPGTHHPGNSCNLLFIDGHTERKKTTSIMGPMAAPEPHLFNDVKWNPGR